MASFRVFSMMDHPDRGRTSVAPWPSLHLLWVCHGGCVYLQEIVKCSDTTQMFPFSFGTLWRKASAFTPTRTCQGGSAVCFPLQREDTFNKSDGRVYFLHVGGRGTQDGHYPLPGNGKVSSRRPHLKGKGKMEICCEAQRGKD